MSTNAELNQARKKLAEALGDDMKYYLLILKSWFRQNISREEFDYDARKLIPNDCLHLHNEFLLAILAKCQALGSSLALKESSANQLALKNRKAKAKKRQLSKTGFNQRFVPSDAMKTAPQTVVKPPEDEGGILFCSRELTLPDTGMIHGRLLVAAWECGLDDVADSAVNLLKIALEDQLKNLITAALSRRSAYRMREARFKYNVGVEIPRVFLRNSQNLTWESEQIPVPHSTILPNEYELEEMNQASALACSSDSEPPPKTLVSLHDLLDGIQQFKPVLASHTIYSTTVEKILHRLWHFSHEEFEQEEIHRQEQVTQREMEVQQAIGYVDWNKPPP